MSIQVLPDLAQRLEDESVGTVGTNIFTGRLPDSPDACIALNTYPGDANRVHGSDMIPVDERFNVQILVRGARDDTAAAATLADSVYDAIQFRHETLDSGRRYGWCQANHMPAQLDRDENDRPRFVINVTIRRYRTTFP